MLFQQLIKEVGEWSHRNFGDQNGLGPIAPLVGIVEEIGEYYESKTLANAIDSLCDIVVYAADLCSRCGVSVNFSFDSKLFDKYGFVHDLSRSQSCLGRISHVLLKRSQGIRGIGLEKAQDVVESEVYRLLVMVSKEYEDNCRQFDDKFGHHVVYTWGRVKQRDWKKNPVDAAAVAEKGL